MKAIKILLSILYVSVTTLNAVTLVYNIRVRRAFNTSQLVEQASIHWLATAVPIYYRRTSHIVDPTVRADVFEKRNVVGSLFNLRYAPSKFWWAEVTSGLEKDSSNFKGTKTFKASRVGWDDIVFTIGYRRFIKDKTQCVAYLIGGVPTRTKLEVTDEFGPLVGGRVYNIGFGLEASYAFQETVERTIAACFQGRFLHGFNRSWTPILPEGSRVAPGNATDLFFVGQWREMFMLYEAGYDATVFSNQAVMLPTITATAKPFVRHSFFATATRGWIETFIGKPILFGLGLSYSFADQFDTKIYNAWCTLSVAF